ncbi:MAG: type II toxin-antitoxin system RelB/DinJ family antitoxin [Patescibacteria group bacterium]
MPQPRMTQIQVRIETKTKNAVRNILDDLGLDMSTAIKMFCKQIERTQSVPLELNACMHPHVMSPKNQRILLRAINEKPSTGERFSSVRGLMADLEG